VPDKEFSPTSVRNTRAVPKPSAVHLEEAEDKDGLARNGTLRRCDLPSLVECLFLFGHNPQPSRTLCPTVFKLSP